MTTEQLAAEIEDILAEQRAGKVSTKFALWRVGNLARSIKAKEKVRDQLDAKRTAAAIREALHDKAVRPFK